MIGRVVVVGSLNVDLVAVVEHLPRAGETVSGSDLARRPVRAVDTVGAGDCLAGWLAAGLAGGLPLERALERAVVASSLAVQRSGAATAMPTADEVPARE